MIKLTDIINKERATDKEAILQMFDVSEERASEIIEVSIAAYLVHPTITAILDYIEKHFKFESQAEVFLSFYTIAIEQGKSAGERFTAEHGVKAASAARYSAARKAADKLKERGFPVPETFNKMMTNSIEGLIESIVKGILKKDGNEGADVEVHVIGLPGEEDDDGRGPFSNKNKFKKGGFDIPDPNEPPKKEGGDNPTEKNT